MSLIVNVYCFQVAYCVGNSIGSQVFRAKAPLLIILLLNLSTENRISVGAPLRTGHPHFCYFCESLVLLGLGFTTSSRLS